MDAYFASPEAVICRSLREVCAGRGPEMVQPALPPDPVPDFAGSCVRGFASSPRRLESRFLYDAEGSALFDEITRQPEYYLTRTEASILAVNAPRIRAAVGPARILELGSGSAAKTDYLLAAWLERGAACYLPVDVSVAALDAARRTIAVKNPVAKVIPINCQYRECFPLMAQLSPLLVTFLGSSIGNFTEPETVRFLTDLALSMRPGDFFLLGIDLVKGRSLLEAAYNDEAGVTARFTRNLFARMNRELGACIDLDAIEHTAWYHAAGEQVEICARFTKDQTFRLTPPGKMITIPQGEVVKTEISRKFRLERMVPLLEGCGFATEGVYTDERRWFALVLLRRRPYYSVPKTGRRR